MRKFYLSVLFLFLAGSAFAQEELSKEEKARREKNIEAGNPFKQFGYKAKVATLSKGKYLEVHDLDSIVIIGSVRFHVDRKEIVGFVQQDSSKGIYARPIGDMPSRWLSPDPLAEEFTSWSPYNFVYNSPLKYSDPTGMAPESIIINNNTGDATYVNDGIDKVFVTNQTGYNAVASYKQNAEGGNADKASESLGVIQKGGYELSMNSDIGLTARIVYAEMGGIYGTSDTDRQVVAESVVNRSESGKFGKTFSEILNKKQYNAVGKPAYNDPFGFVDNLRNGASTKEFFKAKSSAIIGNLENSFSEAFKANKGIGTPVSGGATFYVSPPLKSTHFNSNKQLTNITSSIPGLVGISGVWKLNK